MLLFIEKKLHRVPKPPGNQCFDVKGLGIAPPQCVFVSLCFIKSFLTPSEWSSQRNIKTPFTPQLCVSNF